MTIIPTPDDNSSQAYDEVITSIVDYAYDYEITNDHAWVRAKAALIDALGVALESVHTSPECARLLGPALPLAPGMSGLFRLPGTTYQVDILKGAFDMGTMIRYLDHNDAFPGAEWGHPSGKQPLLLVYILIILTLQHQTIWEVSLQRRISVVNLPMLRETHRLRSLWARY